MSASAYPALSWTGYDPTCFIPLRLILVKMIDAFEADEDVVNVFHNLEMTEELMAALQEE